MTDVSTIPPKPTSSNIHQWLFWKLLRTGTTRALPISKALAVRAPAYMGMSAVLRRRQLNLKGLIDSPQRIPAPPRGLHISPSRLRGQQAKRTAARRGGACAPFIVTL